ncbi:unnamed protein product [Penicillium salamii]|uniref:Uncharacterized protein n=1 Tax=Penicillium salamii TaxID=1612424 RepID=A0A9W4NU14_9EURO|nr:unnamed protein product [Penicillium salamii]CAG8105740.1 unnamed protein product [Penicillium salamii]CAG8384448.1 unnamed protein product [Penicillium salamii]CAG8397381.1 unnamed protein product [Penicillium salamii]CAG8406507.1 unnamed protein product [Penicillium salamii]
MQLTSFLVATLASLVTAAEQSTTRPYFGYGFDWASKLPYPTSTAASVVGITSHLTTYEISCMTGAPKSRCDIDTPWTLIQGSTTFSFTGKYTAATTGRVGTVTIDQEHKCSFTSTSQSASCSLEYEVTGSQSGTTYSTATSTSASNIPTSSVKYYKLPITAGVSKLTSAQTTSTTGGAAPTAKAIITGAPLGAAAAVAIAAMI